MGFEDSNILQSLQIAILQSIHILCPNVARFKKNIIFFENWKLFITVSKDEDFEVARARNSCGRPSSPRQTVVFLFHSFMALTVQVQQQQEEIKQLNERLGDQHMNNQQKRYLAELTRLVYKGK